MYNLINQSLITFFFLFLLIKNIMLLGHLFIYNFFFKQLISKVNDINHH
jgi:hypothetical protein